jgi:hypothetical protein
MPVRRLRRCEYRSQQISRPCTQIENHFPATELQGFDRALSPLLVEAGAQQVVQEVIASRDRVKHPGDAGRLLSWGYQ